MTQCAMRSGIQLWLWWPEHYSHNRYWTLMKNGKRHTSVHNKQGCLLQKTSSGRRVLMRASWQFTRMMLHEFLSHRQLFLTSFLMKVKQDLLPIVINSFFFAFFNIIGRSPILNLETASSCLQDPKSTSLVKANFSCCEPGIAVFL